MRKARGVGELVGSLLRPCGAVSLGTLLCACTLIAPSGDELAAGSAPCPSGTKDCAGSCVPLGDPSTGCALSECSPCALPHASAACQAGSCAVGACAQGWADCDGVADNGCEIALPVGTDGCACQAVRFVDENGALVIDLAPLGPPTLGDGDFTVEAWVMLPGDSQPPNRTALFSTSSAEQPGEPTPVPAFRLSVGATDLRCIGYDGSSTFDTNRVAVAQAIQPLRWAHIACVRSGSTLVAYVDGVERGRARFDVDDIELDRPALGGFNTPTLAGLRLGPMRISKSARYSDHFEPATHWVVDDDTLLQFLVFSRYEELDALRGRLQDESGTELFAVSLGAVARSVETPCDGPR